MNTHRRRLTARGRDGLRGQRMSLSIGVEARFALSTDFRSPSDSRRKTSVHQRCFSPDGLAFGKARALFLAERSRVAADRATGSGFEWDRLVPHIDDRFRARLSCPRRGRALSLP